VTDVQARRARLVPPRRAWAVGAAGLASLALPVRALAGPGLATTAEAAPTGRTVKAAPARLRVASDDVRNASSYEGRPDDKRWEDRRGAVVDTVQGQDLDVLGVQEATQGLMHDKASAGRKVTQFDDLVDRLGGSWRITAATR